VGSWKWDIKNGEVAWSDEMFRLFGIDKSTYTGRLGDAIKNVIHPDDLHIFLASNVSSIVEKRTFEYRIILPDASIHHISAKAGEVIFDGDGKPDVIMGIAQDITERKSSEQALRQAQKLESIGTLAGGIAHDFNNLMNAVLGQSSLALGKLPKESPAAVHITKAIKASERVAELTKQLLAYSGRGKFFIDEIDLNMLVKENVQMLEVSIPKSCQLQYELCSPSPRIMGDVSQLQQVIMNLIINAGEAMGLNPGVISLRTGRIEIGEGNTEYSKYTAAPLVPGSYALLHVQDTGCGISHETLTRIFDPFFTTKFTGRGLGLAAVLGIIKGHQGGLRIESEVGKGTTFDIIFPFITSLATYEVKEKEDVPSVNGAGKTILVIDDEPSVIELLDDILSDVHFTVISVLNPWEGIEIYREHHQKISMVVLDYSMPVMDGKAAFDELLKINKEVKVLLCSGYSEEETMSVFGRERPSGFFQKPYNTDLFVKRVAEVISTDR
jgi:signal transduction histidine kinase